MGVEAERRRVEVTRPTHSLVSSMACLATDTDDTMETMGKNSMSQAISKHHFRFLRGPLYGLAILLFLGTAGVGCRQDPSVARVRECGSNTARGQYYDFRSQSCVTPSAQDLPLLYNFAQLTRITASATGTIRYRLTFTDDAPLSDVVSIIARLEAERIENMLLYFPSVGQGLRAGRRVPVDTGDPHEALASIATKLLSDYQDELQFSESLGAQLKVAIENQDYRINRAEVVGAPSDLLTQWQKHYAIMKNVKPLSSPVPWPDDSEDFFK